MKVNPDQLYTRQQAAEILGIQPYLIRQWHDAEKVMPAGQLRGKGRNGVIWLYTLAELEPLAAAYHHRRAGSPPR